MNNVKGFTLIEVLVATVLTGVAVGALLTGIAQSHRQAFRGHDARQAAFIAETLLRNPDLSSGTPGSEEGEVESHPGWKYRIEFREKEVVPRKGKGKETLPLAEARVVEMTLSVSPPGKASPFVITGWYPAQGR